MITRISKIARLPKSIRDQLHHRLENGQIGRTILPWLNALPETKTVMAEFFAGKSITHQNLSEWRRGGHQDWLQQQHRLEWFDRFTENETELAKHDRAGDTYEAMSRIFLYEIGQGLAALPNLKDPRERFVCLQNLAREFSRLQNAYNFSRKTQLDFDKWNAHPDAEPLPQIEKQDNDEPEDLGAPCRPPGPSPGAPISNRLTAFAPSEPFPESEAPKTAPVPPACPSIENSQLKTADCEPNTAFQTPTCLPHPAELPEEPTACQAIPTPAPTPTPLNLPAPNYPFTQPPTLVHKHIVHSIPRRGRRFVCIEG